MSKITSSIRSIASACASMPVRAVKSARRAARAGVSGICRYAMVRGARSAMTATLLRVGPLMPPSHTCGKAARNLMYQGYFAGRNGNSVLARWSRFRPQPSLPIERTDVGPIPGCDRWGDNQSGFFCCPIVACTRKLPDNHKKHPGLSYGYSCAVPAASCAGLGGRRIQVRPQVMPGNAGLALDIEYPLSGDPFLFPAQYRAFVHAEARAQVFKRHSRLAG